MRLFIANVLWIMIYDTVSAHQDIHDDIKAGVKSMAIRFSDGTRKLVAILATVQVALLLYAGWGLVYRQYISSLPVVGLRSSWVP